MKDYDAGYEAGYSFGYQEGEEEGYSKGCEEVYAELEETDNSHLQELLAERLRLAGVSHLEDFTCRWDAPLERFVVTQNGQEWLI